MTIDDPGHKVTAPVMLDAAARSCATPAPRRCRSTRPGWWPAPPSATSATGVKVDGATVELAVPASRAIGRPGDARRRDADPRWHHRDGPPARRDGRGSSRTRACTIDALQSPRTPRYARPYRTPLPPRDDRRPPQTRSSMSELDYPQDLRYTAEHEWVRTGEDGVVRVGHHLLRPGRPRRRRLRQPAGRRRHAVRRRLLRRGRVDQVGQRPLRAPVGRDRRPSTTPWTARPSWSTPTPTARAGCTRCASPTPARPGRAPGRRRPTARSSAEPSLPRPRHRGARCGTMAVSSGGHSLEP